MDSVLLKYFSGRVFGSFQGLFANMSMLLFVAFYEAILATFCPSLYSNNTTMYDKTSHEPLQANFPGYYLGEKSPIW